MEYIYYNTDSLRILSVYSTDIISHVQAYPGFKTNNPIGLIKKPQEIDSKYPKLFMKNGSLHITNEYSFEPKRWQYGGREGEINEYGSDFFRKKRNQLLTECDWTQVNDIVLPNDRDWKIYRQKLRDITDTDNIECVIWPSKPGNTLSQETQPEIEITEIIDTQNLRDEFFTLYDRDTGRLLSKTLPVDP